MPVPPPTSSSSRADRNLGRAANMRGHALRAAGQCHGELAGRGLLLHGRFQALAIDEGGPFLVGFGTGRPIGPQPLDDLQHAGTGGRQVDIVADVTALRRAPETRGPAWSIADRPVRSVSMTAIARRAVSSTWAGRSASPNSLAQSIERERRRRKQSEQIEVGHGRRQQFGGIDAPKQLEDRRRIEFRRVVGQRCLRVTL